MLKFKEEKATQMASKFIDLAGGEINYMKLINLMYLCERKALLTYGRPIIFDSYVSIKNGPIK